MAAIHGKIAWAVVVLTGPEHVQVGAPPLLKGAGECAVYTLVSSDHAIQRLPSGATDTLGKLWPRPFDDALFTLQGTGSSFHV